MSGKLRISSEERERLVRGETEHFPKYTTQFLNLANQNAQSTREGYVGNMKDILTEFENRHSECTYEEWVNFYEEEYNGSENLEESADRLYEMVEKMRDAIQEIDRDMAFRYVQQLVLYKTYMGEDLDVEEVILKKLSQVYGDVERMPESWISARVDGVPIVLQSKDAKFTEKPGEDVAVISYMVSPSNSIEIDPYELNQKLGSTLSEEGNVHRSLGDFSLSL